MSSITKSKSVDVSLSDAFHNKTNLDSNQSSFASFSKHRVSLNNFISHVLQGKAWAPAAFKSGRSKSNFLSSQLLALDFDNDVSVEKALEDPFIRQYAFFAYPTPSSTPEKPRTRVVFILDEPVKQASHWETLQLGLIEHLQHLKPDLACKDAARMYYGSDVAADATHINLEAVLPVEIAGGLTLPHAQRDLDRIEISLQVQNYTDQTKPNGGKLSPNLAAEVEKRLGTQNVQYSSSGFTNDAIVCPMKAHEHDEERPAAYWNRDKKIIYCHKCGQHYLTHDVAAALGITISEYYRYDALPEDETTIHCSHRYITEYPVTDLIQQGVDTLLIKSPTGSGKTELIKKMINDPDSRVLIIVHRRSLAHSMVQRLNETAEESCKFAVYDDLTPEQMCAEKRLCICVNSLHKLIEYGKPIPRYDLIVLDEIEQLHTHLVGDTFEGSEAVDTFATLNALVKESKVVLGLDAYATTLSLNWLKRNRDQQKLRLIINKYTQTPKQLKLYNDLSEVIAAANGILEMQANEGRIVFAVASKELAKVLYTYFSGKPLISDDDVLDLNNIIGPNVRHMLSKSPHHLGPEQVKIIYGDNTDSNETQDLLDHINERLPSLKVLIYTSAMGTGIDIQFPVQAVFGVFTSGILPADETLQMLARCRNTEEFYVCIQGGNNHAEINANALYQDELEKATKTKQFLYNGGRTLWRTAENGIVAIDENQEKYLRIWSETTAKNNRSRNWLADEFLKLAQPEYGIENLRHGPLLEEDIDEGLIEIREDLRKIKKGVADVEKQMIIQSAPINKQNYRNLQIEYGITPQVFAGHIRWTIESGYRQPITSDLYDHWLAGGLWQLRNFIMLQSTPRQLLNKDFEQEHAGYAIPGLSHYNQRNNLLSSAFKAVFGESQHLENTDYVSETHINQSLADFIKAHRKELWSVFGWRQDHNAEPINVLRRLLKAVGLKLPQVRTGKRRNCYFIDKTSLATMQDYYRTYLQVDESSTENTSAFVIHTVQKSA